VWRAPPAVRVIFLDPIHGAITRSNPDATSFPHRPQGAGAGLILSWRDPSKTAEVRAWADKSWATLQTYIPNAYVNMLDDEGAARVKAAAPSRINFPATSGTAGNSFSGATSTTRPTRAAVWGRKKHAPIQTFTSMCAGPTHFMRVFQFDSVITILYSSGPPLSAQSLKAPRL
jgi:hypothetical protein